MDTRNNAAALATGAAGAALSDEYLKVKQVAEILNVSPNTVLRRFDGMPGVMDLGHEETQNKRRYRELRILRSVVNKYRRERTAGTKHWQVREATNEYTANKIESRAARAAGSNQWRRTGRTKLLRDTNDWHGGPEFKAGGENAPVAAGIEIKPASAAA